MTDVGAIEERLSQFLQLEEDCFIARYHQRVEKERQKAQHDQHIKFMQFQPSDFVLLYDNNFLKHLGKLHTHYLGTYVVNYVTDKGCSSVA